MDNNKTTIEFNFMPRNNKDYTELKIKLEVKKFVHNCNDSKIIVIPYGTNNNDYYYTELFIIYKEENDPLNIFQMNIYYGIENHIFYDLEEKKQCSLEIFFYAKQLHLLPLSINYKKKSLLKFDYNRNIFRKRIYLANINPEELEYVNYEIIKKKNFKFSQDSYQAIIKIDNNSKFHYSLTAIENAILNPQLKQNNIIAINLNIKGIIEEFNTFYTDFIENVNDINKPLDELEEEFNFIKNLYEEFKKNEMYDFFLNPLSYNNVNDSLELLYYYYKIYEFQYLTNDGKNDLKKSNYRILKKYITDNNKIIKKLYDKLKSDKTLNNEDKIRIFLTTSLFVVKTIKSKHFVDDINYINIDNIRQKNPYYKANKLLEDIIENLTEESRLFEPFLYFDSNVIKNYLENEIINTFTYTDIFGNIREYKNEKFKTEYGLNLLNINQIKNHLKQLIPKFIIRIETNLDLRAYYDNNTGIMIINEYVMFNEKISFVDKLYEEKESDIFVIPILIEILHEIMSHSKLRIKDKNIKSPRQYNDSKNNFEAKNILKNIIISPKENKLVAIGESGKVLENYISENKNIINSLKTAKKENTILIDYRYWVGSDFSELEKIVSLNKDVNNIIDDSPILIDQIDDNIYNNFDGCYIDRPY